MTEISDNEHKILVELNKGKNLTMYGMERKTGLDKSTIRHWLKKLVKKGLVTETTCAGKSTFDINKDTVVMLDGVMWVKVDNQVMIYGSENSELCQKISHLFRG